MAGFVGRKIILTWGGQQIDGVREKSAALNGEPIDVTADESDGWRELLADPGQNEANISISGVTKSDRLKDDWFNGDRMQTATITYPDGGVLSGTFFLASYTDTGAYNDATTFQAELQSSGEVAYAPPA